MGSVVTEYGGRVHVVSFSDDTPASDTASLTAAVVWRTAPRPDAPATGWRSLLRRLRFRLGPLGAGFHLRWQTPHACGGSAGANGEWETLYNRERRVVRVLGREYALPVDGRTLVLLVDEGGTAGAAPTVRVRTVLVPSLPRAPTAPPFDGAAAGSEAPAAAIERYGTWRAALRSDPEVRAFMDDAGDEGA